MVSHEQELYSIEQGMVEEEDSEDKFIREANEALNDEARDYLMDRATDDEEDAEYARAEMEVSRDVSEPPEA